MRLLVAFECPPGLLYDWFVSHEASVIGWACEGLLLDIGALPAWFRRRSSHAVTVRVK